MKNSQSSSDVNIGFSVNHSMGSIISLGDQSHQFNHSVKDKNHNCEPVQNNSKEFYWRLWDSVVTQIRKYLLPWAQLKANKKSFLANNQN